MDQNDVNGEPEDRNNLNAAEGLTRAFDAVIIFWMFVALIAVVVAMWWVRI